ncbi:MAG: cytochrome oxidase subunit III [Gammaproteobacteria bacterium]|nr:cytochrome oxidase subunit III [Gammaproteobacteria bacterium]
MTIALVFLALILATLLGWLLKQTFNAAPWEMEAVGDTAHHGPLGGTGNKSKLIALLTFLAVVTSFFALILSAYALRMELGDWIPLTEPQLLWVNTIMLIVASIVFQWTRNAAVNDQQSRLKLGMIITGVLTWGFLIGQFIAWQQLQNLGQFVSSNPSNAFFYFLTGAHAIHILGGLYVWAKATSKIISSARSIDDTCRSIELCTIYWHFLLIVWLIIFGLMLST